VPTHTQTEIGARTLHSYAVDLYCVALVMKCTSACYATVDYRRADNRPSGKETYTTSTFRCWSAQGPYSQFRKICLHIYLWRTSIVTRTEHGRNPFNHSGARWTHDQTDVWREIEVFQRHISYSAGGSIRSIRYDQNNFPPIKCM
jgi:hypothetical protein